MQGYNVSDFIEKHNVEDLELSKQETQKDIDKYNREKAEFKSYFNKLIFILISIVIFAIVVLIYTNVKPLFMPRFLNNVSDETTQNYIEYISKYNEETEHINIHSWIIPLAYIYILDDNRQFDEGEQYLLNQFKEEGLINAWYDEQDFEKYFNEHPEVIKNFYEKSGVSFDGVTIDKEQIQQEVIKIQKKHYIFTSIIEEKIA